MSEFIDEAVLAAAIRQLQTAVIRLESIQNFYIASEKDEASYKKRRSEAVANIRKALARVKE